MEKCETKLCSVVESKLYFVQGFKGHKDTLQEELLGKCLRLCSACASDFHSRGYILEEGKEVKPKTMNMYIVNLGRNSAFSRIEIAVLSASAADVEVIVKDFFPDFHMLGIRKTFSDLGPLRDLEVTQLTGDTEFVSGTQIIKNDFICRLNTARSESLDAHKAYVNADNYLTNLLKSAKESIL
jgi:hypothetical protein